MFKIIPLHWHIGPCSIHGFGIMLALGLYWMFYLIARRIHATMRIPLEDINSAMMWCTLSGLVGARIWHTIMHYNEYDSLRDFFSITQGGIAILGALGGALAAALFFIKKHGWPLLPLLDNGALYASLGHFFGRLGCLWAGCCYGVKSVSRFTLMYEGITSGAPQNTLLIPLQVYSALYFLGLFLFIRYYVAPKKNPAGIISCWYFLGTASERFFFDFWREERGAIFFSLSLNQWLALVYATVALVFMLYLYYGQKEESI